MFWLCAALAFPLETDLRHDVREVVEAAGVRIEIDPVREPVFTALFVVYLGKRELRVGADYSPNRVALSPDGQFVAFVSGHSGLASLYIAPTHTDTAPIQLTNVGIQGPEGFVPPPSGSPVFAGEMLVWTDGTGQEHRRRWVGAR